MDPDGLFFLLAVLCGILTPLEGRHRGKGCPIGCSTCSAYNGCSTCKPRYYFLLHRSGMKQVGLCTFACPVGFYPNSADGYHRCSRCRIDNCETCNSRAMCSRCKPPYVGLHGKCVIQCPEFMYADLRTGQCEVKVDCEVSHWSGWGPCMKRGKSCGAKWGQRSRYRDVLTRPTTGGAQCPELQETAKCRVHPRYCPGQIPKRQRDRKHRKNAREPEDDIGVEGGGARHNNDRSRKKDRTNKRSRKGGRRGTTGSGRRRRKGTTTGRLPDSTDATVI